MKIIVPCWIALVLSVPVSANAQCSTVGCADEGCAAAVSFPFGEQLDPGTIFNWPCQDADAGVAKLDEPIVTDRPDFTEASSVVGKGVAQLEVGYTFVRGNDGSDNHSYPEPLLRYGLLKDWLELRVGWNYASQSHDVTSVQGSEDLYLGFKIGLTPQDGILPEMSVIPQMTVATGHDSFTSDRTLPGVNWLYGWDINDFLSAAGSTQWNRAVDESTGTLYSELAQSWTFGYSLSDNVGAYTEWYAFFPSGADTQQTEHYFNGGFAFLLTNDVQWDIRAGMGLNDAADDFLVGTGLSIRFR